MRFLIVCPAHTLSRISKTEELPYFTYNIALSQGQDTHGKGSLANARQVYLGPKRAGVTALSINQTALREERKGSPRKGIKVRYKFTFPGVSI